MPGVPNGPLNTLIHGRVIIGAMAEEYILSICRALNKSRLLGPPLFINTLTFISLETPAHPRFL